MFVGRDKESQRLEALLTEVANGSPVTVMLQGEAGVGKSRLLDEFARKAVDAKAFVLAGSCIDLGGGAAIPYAPLIEALRLLVRQQGPQQAERLAGPAWAELAGLIADFTHGSELPTAAASGSQVRVFGAVSRLLDHIGKHAPVVLVFEDVHWADPSTLDLIAFLTQTKSDQRMMLTCSYRSGLPLRHPLRAMLAEPQFARQVTRIQLPRFTSTEMRSFIAALVSEPISPQRLERYLELAEGNPYFAEQLVSADDLQVPESLNEIMRMRVAQLSADATSVVRVAAVAGRRVSDRLLATVVNLDETSLDAALRECIDRRVLVEDQTDEDYLFQHALMRETVYGTVPMRQRRRLHAAMAKALALEVNEQARLWPELAYHWFAADHKTEALDAAIRAGMLAVRIRAFQEAETQYQRALELWPLVPDAERVAGLSRVRVLSMAADAARWAGHVDHAVVWAGQAIGEMSLEADPALAGELHERLGSYQWEAGVVAESVEAYREARRLLVGQPPSAVSSRVQSAMATAAIRAGRYTEGLRLAESAVAEARSVAALVEKGRALNSMGLALTMLGRPDEGVPALRQAQRIAHEADHLEDMLRACGNLGVCLEHAGMLTDAVEVLLEGLEKARGHGVFHTRQSGVLANNAGAALFMLGRWDQAVELLDEVLLYRPASETRYQRLTKAEIDVACGRFEEADRLLESVRAHPSTDPRFIAPLYACLAELAIWRDDMAAAQSAVVHGIEAVMRTENSLALLQLCALGLRIATDESENGPAVREWAQSLADSARQVAERDSPHLETAVLARLCEAEDCRLRDVDAVEIWSEVAKTWADLERPYLRAYALMREAAAAVETGAKDRATQAAGLAHSIAGELGAQPLRKQITGLARRHRLSLAAGQKPPARPFGLTEREFEVLREVAGGRTNREIGRNLHIAETTASVHVTNILKKLAAANRTEAAGIARKNGMF